MPPDSIIDAILEPAAGSAPPLPSGGTQAGGGGSNAPSRDPASGRFASQEAQDGEDDAEGDAEELEAEGDPSEPQDEAAEEEAPEEEAAPENLDDYTIDVVVDGKPQEVTLRELKQNYSGTAYIQKNIQQAVEHRKAQEHAAQQTYAALEQQVQHLQAIEQVWSQFANPQVNWEELKARDPQAYVLKREEFRDAQEKAQRIQQEISARQQKQADITAQQQQQRVADETRVLLEKLPVLADPQKAPAVMEKIYAVAQSYGVPKAEVNGISGHIPIMVLAELAHRREQVAQFEARLKRPAGDQPRPKVMLRPGQAQPAQTSSKKLQIEQLKRARATGKPDDVAATLLVSRRKT